MQCLDFSSQQAPFSWLPSSFIQTYGVSSFSNSALGSSSGGAASAGWGPFSSSALPTPPSGGPSVASSSSSQVALLVAATGATLYTGPVLSSLSGATTRSGYANGPLTAAAYSKPAGMARSSDGSVFVADSANNRVRVINLTTGEEAQILIKVITQQMMMCMHTHHS